MSPRSPHARFTSRLLLGLAAALAACADGTGPGPRPNSQQSGAYDLVFDGEVSLGRPVLFRVAPDGSMPAPIGGGIEGRRPSPSPDGSRIAFSSLGSDAELPRLMLVSAAGGVATWLDGASGALEREVSWAPDGRRIAFHSQQDDPAGDIFAADIADGRITARRNLTPRGPHSPEVDSDATPAFSPDGSRIAFTGYRSGGAAIWIMNADGSGSHQVTAIGQYGDYFPTWSSDGRWIAFQRITFEHSSIGIVSAEGGATRLLSLPGNAYAPAWAPDGDRIAVTLDVGTDLDIAVVSPEGTMLRRIRREGIDRNPAWLRVAR